MAQDITLLGASYEDVPAVELPKTGGGTASFFDVSDTTAEAADVASGKYFYNSSGTRTLGSGDYMDKVSSPTADDVLVTDANGQAVDSGVDINDVAIITSAELTALETKLGL